MKYSEAFERLYDMSLDIDLMTEVKYKRVATYIGRVMMAENGNARLVVHDNLRPMTELFEWAATVKGCKEKMLSHIIQLTDYEWKMIRMMMMEYAERSQGSPQWKAIVAMRPNLPLEQMLKGFIYPHPKLLSELSAQERAQEQPAQPQAGERSEL